MIRIIALAALLALCGCNNPQSFGIGPWPVYAEPPPLEFTPDEQAALENFSRGNPELFKRIQGQAHAYRAIVQEHNRRAKEMNKKQLKTLGFDDEALKQTLSE
jgi:hypothetical protein